MQEDTPHILLINPWIHDFAAYDFWARPIGLLTIAGILRMHGYQVSYIDCLDRFHPELSHIEKAGRFGKGHYPKTRIPKPEKLYDVPRNYCRYGIPERLVRMAINDSPRPEAVLVTSLMTYWYPGVIALIEVVREMLPEVPVVLGGIYDEARDYAGITQAQEAAQLYKARGCDALIALGDSPVVDLTKAVNILVSENFPIPSSLSHSLVPISWPLYLLRTYRDNLRYLNLAVLKKSPHGLDIPSLKS